MIRSDQRRGPSSRCTGSSPAARGSGQWPQNDRFAHERRAYERAVDAALEQQIGGKMSMDVIKGVKEAIEGLSRALDAAVAPGKDQLYRESKERIKELRRMADLLGSQKVERVLGEIDNYAGTTVNDLRMFMRDHNLRFAAAPAPRSGTSIRASTGAGRAEEGDDGRRHRSREVTRGRSVMGRYIVAAVLLGSTRSPPQVIRGEGRRIARPGPARRTGRRGSQEAARRTSPGRRSRPRRRRAGRRTAPPVETTTVVVAKAEPRAEALGDDAGTGGGRTDTPPPSIPARPRQPDPFWITDRMKRVWAPTTLGSAEGGALTERAKSRGSSSKRNRPRTSGPYLQRAEKAAEPLLESGVRKDHLLPRSRSS